MPPCKTPDCGAEIDWAVSADGKTRMPVDHESAGHPDGTLAVWRGQGGILKYRNLAAGEELQAFEVRGTSHYKTCTRPADHSRHARPDPDVLHTDAETAELLEREGLVPEGRTAEPGS